MGLPPAFHSIVQREERGRGLREETSRKGKSRGREVEGEGGRERGMKKRKREERGER